MRGWIPILGMAGLLACSGGVPRHPQVESLDEHFSGELARAHVDSLSVLVPRLPGSREDGWARDYILRELVLAGLEVAEIDTPVGRHLLAARSGDSSDRLLLVAPYSTMGLLEAPDDSGVGVLLEVARVFARAPEPPYTLEFAFCEIRPAAPERAVASGSISQSRIVAGRSLAGALEQSGGFAGLRGVVVFDRVGSPGLRLTQDLLSHPVFRGIFWEAARGRGLQDTFPVDSGWASVEGLQVGFRERSMDRVVTLSDEAFARPDLGDAPRTVETSRDTLEAVGVVTVDALGRIMQRLAKIDAFTLPPPDLTGNP